MAANAAFALAPAPSPFAIFHNRRFTLLWSGELVSTIGSALTELVSSILVFRLTGSALSVGLMLMAAALPTLFVGLIAGVIADRANRKVILISADLIRAVLVFLIPVLIPHGIAWLYVIVALSSAVGQFYEPAHESVLPEVATDEALAAANSLMAISSFGSTAVGFAASGLIASAFPIEWAFYINAVTFVFSALCVAPIRFTPLKVEGKTNAAVVLHNLRSGAVYVIRNRILRSVFIIGIIYALSIGLWDSLLLPFSIRALHASEFQYGLQEGLTSVGFVIGSLLMASLADRWREGQWVVIGLIGMGLVGALYSLSLSIPVATALIMISGFMNAPYGIARRLLIQRNTPREMRGRVNSTFFVSRDVVLLFGMIAAGLADAIDVRLLMLLSSAVIIVPGLMALVLPGLGQPAAEWRRALSLLRTAGAAPRPSDVRAATMADFDRLAMRLPAIAGLSADIRASLVKQARISELPAGTAVLRIGDKSDAAYFILDGRAVAGEEKDDAYRVLEVMSAGDYFGEIAALTGTPRTANVVTAEATTLFQVPSESLRGLMADPTLSRLVLSKMNERLNRSFASDLPRLAGIDQQSRRDLLTPQAE